MAKFENMTLSYTQIASIPFKTRKNASGSLLDALSRELTPGQRVALFPSYVNQVYASGGYGEPRKEASLSPGDVGVPNVPPTVDVVSPPKKQSLANPKVPDIIPSGLVPDPVTGLPMRVPDTRRASTNIKTGDRFQDVIKNYKSRMMKDLGITDFQADGVLGNLAQESDRFRAYNEYGGGPGIGWAQWTTKARKEAFLSFSKEKGLDPTSDEASYLYLVHEIKNRPDLLPGGAKTLDKLRATKTAGEATESFMNNFEAPGIPHFDTRLKYTNEIAGIPYSEENLTETERLSNTYDLPQEEIDNATAEPITNIATASSDDLVVQRHNGTRDLDLDPQLNNVLTYSADQMSRRNGKKIKWVSESGGQPPKGVGKDDERIGTSGHDHGKASDGHYIEIMPDGSERELLLDDPSDQKLIAQGMEYVAQAGATEVGAKYEGMKNNIHVAISGDSGVYSGPEWLREAYNSGKEQMLSKEQFQEWMDNREKEKQKTRNANIVEPVNSVEATQTESPIPIEYTEQGKPIDPDTGFLMSKDDPRYPVAETQTATPVAETQTTNSTSYSMSELTGTATPVANTQSTKSTSYSMSELTGTGYNAAAGGAEITDPSMIISEDGKKVTRVAETGPEKISVMPRHKSSDVFQEQQVMFQQEREEKSKEDLKKKDIAEIKSDPIQSNFGRPIDQGQTAVVPTTMSKISLSANKAFADAKMVGRFNKAGVDGDMGIVYIDRGYV